MIDMSTRPASGDVYLPNHTPGRTTWNRIWQYPSARLQPLDAGTLHEASQVRVWVDGEQAAIIRRSGSAWALHVPGQGGIPAAFGASALEAATNWLVTRSTEVAA